MKFSSVESVRWEPGSVVRWELSAARAPSDVGVSPSENEIFHLDTFERTGTAGWLAVSLEVPTAVPPADIERAVGRLIRRHEILRCHFTTSAVSEDPPSGPDADRYRRLRTAIDDVRCVASEIPVTSGDGGPAPVLGGQIEQACSPLRPLSHYVASIHRARSTTLILGFDHCYVDAYSLAIIAREICADLGLDASTGAGSGEGGRADGVESVFLEHRRSEESAVAIGDDDPRLRAWGDFLAATDWEVPTFPLDLGVAPGDKAPMRTEMHTLLDADEAAIFRKTLHRKGIRSFPALLTAAATAVEHLGGPARLPMVLPVRTKFGQHHLEAVGWMVGNAPILVHTDADPMRACHLNAAALADAVGLADVGLTSVFGAFGDRMRRIRDDVFMVSYVDYNRLPISNQVVATHISGSRPTDTAQWWFSHDPDGVHMRLRYPDTARAARTMGDLTGLMDAGVADLAMASESAAESAAAS